MIAAALLAALVAVAPPPPTADVLADLAEAMTASQRSQLDALFAPGSAAHTYFEAGVLFEEFPSPDPFMSCMFSVQEEQIVPSSDDCGPTLSNVVLDAAGLITDVDRDGRPLSQTVHPIGVTTELAPGVTVAVHSARHFDGATVLAMVIENGGDEEVFAWCQTFVTEAGRQHEAVYSPPNTFPGATIADVNVWEVADEGGTAHCAAGSYSGADMFAEWTVQIPPVGVALPPSSVSLPPPATT